jgi:polyisoprenoid-binding protein YceI
VTSTDQTTAALSGTWALDPAKTTVSFRTKAMWVLPVKATGKALSGAARIRPDGDVQGTLVIDAASFDTKNKKRDDHLRTGDFLEVDKYPTITFTANSGRLVGHDRFEVTGVLTVRDQSRPVTLHATVTSVGSSATVEVEAEIDRSLWGVSWAKMGSGLKNQVAIRAHFDRA